MDRHYKLLVKIKLKRILSLHYKIKTTKTIMVRNLLVATYSTQSVFKLPKGIDLDNKLIVEWYVIEWDTLNIKYVDKEEIESIKCCFTLEGLLKHPENVKIEDFKEWSEIIYDSQEEEDKEEDEEEDKEEDED